jgi:hypothetical protein
MITTSKIRMNRRISFFTLLILVAANINAQLGNNGPFGKNPNNFVPATPEATAFQRYGDLPVSYEYGLANISIPLGSINLKNFSWPVTLSYHTGGNRLGDVASSSGLGWVLNASGSSSNKVVGSSAGTQEPNREFLNLYSYYGGGEFHECEYYDDEDVALADNIAAGATDYEPDLSYINTPLFNLKAIGGMIFPATDFKGCSGNVTIGGVTYNFGGGIQDTRGNRYYFGLSTYNFVIACYTQTAPPINTGSVLTKILTYTGDVITFDYDTVIIGYDMLPMQYRAFAADYQCQRCNYEINSSSVSCNSVHTAKEAYLTKIESSNGDIVRLYYSSRSDLTDGKKLDSVVFKRKFNGTEETIKKFVLVHSYFGSGSDPEDFRLKLTELQLYDKNSAHINSYFFDYDSITLPNRVTSKAVDWWGYYNGQTGNSSLIADVGNRNGNFTYAKACILNKVAYPTGGYTTLEYEMNPFGGLRVKKLTDNDGITSTQKVRSFNYHTAVGDGTNNGQVFDDFLVSNYLATDFNGNFDVQNEESIYLLSCYTHRVNSSPVTTTIMNLIENVDYYSNVTEYFGADSTNGKIEYTFGNNAYETGGAYSPVHIDLLKKKIYRWSGSSFQLVSEVENIYDQLYPDTCGIFSDPIAPFEQRIWVKDVSKLSDDMSYSMVFVSGTKYWCKSFIDNTFCISTMPIQLTRTIEKSYEPGTSNVVIDTTQFYYDDDENMQPTRIRKTNSKGDEILITNTYPTGSIPAGVSLTTPEQDALAALVNQNLRNNPYYIEIAKNSTVIHKQLNTYQETQGLPVLKKEKEYVTGGSDFYEYQFNNYDNKVNVTDFLGKDKIFQGMLYDSASNLLAHCVNCQTSELAYTSFETGSTGNWTGISSGNVQNSGGITGRKYYSQTSFSLSKSGLTSGNYYIVSYWSKNGSYTISGTQSGYPKTLNAITQGGNTWTLYEHLVTGQSTVTVTGSGSIDELRLHPKDGVLTTYCYSPAVGITTQSDAAGRINYYEYDEIGRLKLVRDQNQNILNKYEYKYSSQ